MIPSLLSRLINRLRVNGKSAYPRRFCKSMFQADAAVHAPFSAANVFRPSLEVLEDRLAPTVSFAPEMSFTVGNTPSGTAVGDLNGDGKPDIVETNEASGTVSVLLNTTPARATTPSFAIQQTFSVGASPVAVAIGDVNGDGKQDLAVINSTAGTVTILLNTTPSGSTTLSFAAPLTFAIGSTPSGVSFADINGDGRPDLVVTDSGSNDVGVLLNTTFASSTLPSFTAEQTFATGTDPFGSAAIGDLTGDGRPDIVVANSTSNDISVLVNTTPSGATVASFAAQQTFGSLNGPAQVALADLNGDGKPDMIVANYGTGSTSVAVFMNTSAVGGTTAAFSAQQTFTAGSKPRGVVVGDFSGDGKPDIAVGNSDGTVSILENTTGFAATAASFAAQQTFATNGSPSWFEAAADFNGDGLTDLAVANSVTSGTVSVLLNNIAVTQSTVTGPVEVGDFTGYGVQQFNQASQSWVALTPVDANVLAANANGVVVGNFPGYGVQLYRPGSGWAQITPSAASSLAIDALGDIVGNFPGYGVFIYRVSTGWVNVTPVAATEVQLDAYGNAYGTFPGYGIQQYLLAARNWVALNAQTPSTFAVNAYDQIVASFPGLGLYKFIPYTGWQRLTTYTATAVAINSYGVIVVNFPIYGVDELTPNATTFSSLTPSAASQLAITRYGQLYGAFPGYGTYSYQPLVGWTAETPVTASVLAIADYPFGLSSPFAD